MGWIDAYIENRDGSRGRTICNEGLDPLRDNAPKKQIEREIEEFELWAEGRKEPA